MFTRLAVVASLGALLVTARVAAAQSGGGVLSFAILGGPAVTCTSSTTSGDIGVATTTAFTNTGCSVSGNIHAGDAVAAQAYNDYLNTYNNIAATACSGATLTGTLAGRILPPGIYCVSAEAKTGVLTFKVTDGASTGALTGTSFSVVMAGGGQACNVIWWSEAAATLTDSNLKGNILSGAGLTLTRGSIVGRALAKAGGTLTGVTSLGVGSCV